MENNPHPADPRSNVAKFAGFDPDKYALDQVSMTVITDEGLTPGRPPCLTQNTVAKFLQPLTRELVAVPPRPTIQELPEAVINAMVTKDIAFWVDKPGSNAYSIQDAIDYYKMTSEKVLPHHQAVFPRSYQFDIDCVRHRRLHACDGLKQPLGEKQKSLSPHCRDCRKMNVPGLTPFQLAWAPDPGQRRWREYPDLTAKLTPEEIKKGMAGFGKPYLHEAISWYNKNYPAVKYECIARKFSK